MSKKDRVILDLPRKLTLAIDRAVDIDVYATNRRAFILSAIQAKLNDVNSLSLQPDESNDSENTIIIDSDSKIEFDDGYTLPADRDLTVSSKSKKESQNEAQLCKDLIRFFRYENRPVSMDEIKNLFQQSFSNKLIEDQLSILEEEGVLYKLKQDIYCLSR